MVSEWANGLKPIIIWAKLVGGVYHIWQFCYIHQWGPWLPTWQTGLPVASSIVKYMCISFLGWAVKKKWSISYVLLNIFWIPITGRLMFINSILKLFSSSLLTQLLHIFLVIEHMYVCTYIYVISLCTYSTCLFRPRVGIPERT